MTSVIALMTIAPAAVAAGLLLLKSAGLTFALFHGGVCLLVPLSDMFIHRRPHGQFLRSCGFIINPRERLSSVLWGLAAFALVFLFFMLFHHSIWDSAHISRVISLWGVHLINPFSFVAMMVLGNAFLEEFFWRGYIIGKLSKLASNRAVILLSAAFYASYHTITTGVLFSLPYALISSVSVFAAGIIWGSIRLRTGSLLFPVVTHLFVDLAVMAAYLTYLA